MKIQIALTSLALIFSSGTFAAPSTTPDQPGSVQNDQELVADLQAQRGADYVQAGNLEVIQILPDDVTGLPHQKWIARTSAGESITIVYNSNMGTRVPIKVGDRFAVGGKLLWLGHSGLIHWTHDDPRKTRPDGYIFLGGVVYGDTDHEDDHGGSHGFRQAK